MNLDDVLERGLAAAAQDYDVPADGVDRLREQLAPASTEATEDVVRRRSLLGWRPSGHAWLGVAAALIVVLIAVPIAIGGGGGGGDEAGSAGTAAANSPNVGFQKLGPGATRGAKSSVVTGGPQQDAGQPPLAAPAPAPAHADSNGGFVGEGLSTTAGGSGTAGDAYTPARTLEPVPVDAARVEKTGELDLQVSKGQVSATLGKISDIARLERGYVSDSRTDEAGSAPSGEVTLRVPVDRFEQTVHDARSITGTKVLSLQTSGVDVTSKYVDLQARIKSLKATRSTFLAILAKATTIGETLSVQQRVTDVQTQIEQLQGQLRVLASTTSMSTLTVTVDQKVAAIAVKKPHHDNGFVKAVKLSVSRFVHGVEAIVGILGPIVLVLLIVVLGWLAARFGYRATRRHLV